MIVAIVFLSLLLLTVFLLGLVLASQNLGEMATILYGIILVNIAALVVLIFVPKDLITLAVVGVMFLASLLLTPLLLTGNYEAAALVINGVILILVVIVVLVIVGRIIAEKKR